MEIKKERSQAYPAYTLLESVEVVGKIYQNYGSNTFVSREDIAKILKLSTGAAVLRISACVQYGLLEMKTNKGYKPTDVFRRITKPLNSQEKKEALIESFSTPKLYSALIQGFEEGDRLIPSPQGLAVLLARKHGITDSASDKAAKVFLENIENLEINRNGHFYLYEEADNVKFDNQTQSEEENANKEDYEIESKKEGTSKSYKKIKSEEDYLANEDLYTLEIPFSNERSGYLKIPKSITQEDYDFMIQLLTIYGQRIVKELSE